MNVHMIYSSPEGGEKKKEDRDSFFCLFYSNGLGKQSVRLSVCLDELLAFTQDGLHRQIVIYLRQHPYRLAPIQGVLTVPYIIFNVPCNCSKLLVSAPDVL